MTAPPQCAVGLGADNLPDESCAPSRLARSNNNPTRGGHQRRLVAWRRATRRHPLVWGGLL